jgi:hypothetical protein
VRHDGLVKAIRVVALAALCLVPSAGQAQIIRWEEDDGTLHFTNAPDRTPGSSQPRPVPPGQGSPDGARVQDGQDASPAAITNAALTRIPFAPGAPIIVSARISDASAPVSLILDTGADRTMVAPQALWRIGISTHNAPRAMIRGVTGASHGEVIQVTSLQVGNARVGPLPIVAHDADLKQAEGLLGRDFLEQFTVTIDAREQVVTLTPK